MRAGCHVVIKCRWTNCSSGKGCKTNILLSVGKSTQVIQKLKRTVPKLTASSFQLQSQIRCLSRLFFFPTKPFISFHCSSIPSLSQAVTVVKAVVVEKPCKKTGIKKITSCLHSASNVFSFFLFQLLLLSLSVALSLSCSCGTFPCQVV